MEDVGGLERRKCLRGVKNILKLRQKILQPGRERNNGVSVSWVSRGWRVACSRRPKGQTTEAGCTIEEGAVRDDSVTTRPGRGLPEEDQ
jgi:hypothetical protein